MKGPVSEIGFPRLEDEYQFEEPIVVARNIGCMDVLFADQSPVSPVYNVL